MQSIIIAVSILGSVGFLVWLLSTFKKAGKVNAINKFLDRVLELQHRVLGSFASHERSRVEHTELRLDLLDRIRERNRISKDG